MPVSASRASAATCAARVPAVSPNGSGPANLATIRAAVIAAPKDAGYLHIPKAGATIPTPKPSASTASIRTEADIHGTRRSPALKGEMSALVRGAARLLGR
jgi:hypothetical protein